MTDRADVIVVGSGPSAANAARVLVRAGLHVRMLDVGHRDETYAPLIPEQSFEQIRSGDAHQHRYFLGDSFEGVPMGAVRVGAQLTPPRSFIARDTDVNAPIATSSFIGMESHALGGLGAGWGAGVGRFTSEELARTPLTSADLAPHYEEVERHIGICGEPDDLSETLGDHAGMMPPLPVEPASRELLERYISIRPRLQAQGLRMGVTRLAVCTQSHEGRGPHPLRDMDFWADHARAVYRPRWTVEELQTLPNFEYVPSRLVETFQEQSGVVEVTSRDLATRDRRTDTARALVLAAGTLGTARIVLRSLNRYGVPVPLVVNPYTYVPCINLKAMMVGGYPPSSRHSLSQLTAVFQPPDRSPPLHVSIYSYRSLLTFKLLKETPLAAASARRLLQALLPTITILGVHHPDAPDPGKSIQLVRDPRGGPDQLAIDYAIGPSQSARINAAESACLRCFKSMGCLPIRKIRPGHGSSIHYAGTFPMRSHPTDTQTWPDGRLGTTRNVYLADGSLLPDLPAKGLTLTLMAQANRVATLLLQRLRA